MHNLRKKFERFCYKHRRKGIPNLMMYVSLGSALVYIMSMYANNSVLYNFLCFDRDAILQGQLWRLFTYPLTYGVGSYNVFFVAIGLLCYYSLGRAMENVWGTLRFNLYYLTGIVMMDVFCLIFGASATVNHLNLSLFLAYATMYPDAHFLLFFIIPVKAWIFALFDLALIAYDVIMLTSAGYIPYNLYPLIPLLNYFLFFGKDVLNLIPITWRANFRRLFRRKPAQRKRSQQPKVVPFPSAGSYQATVATPKQPYTHRCTVCGRTDVSDPQLEFRYCSRCKGYYCYCEDHISSHTHIEE